MIGASIGFCENTFHVAPAGSLDVTGFPVLTVYVDNKRIGDTPQSVKLPVGKHVVRLKNEDRDERVPITITENKTTKIDRTK